METYLIENRDRTENNQKIKTEYLQRYINGEVILVQRLNGDNVEYVYIPQLVPVSPVDLIVRQAYYETLSAAQGE
jgi:hypothetical protein